MIPEISKNHWEKIGYRHHHGIALSLGSLRLGPNSAIGEFLDLIPLIQWCTTTGFDVIQLLPINDSGHDPSPYSAHTAMGLHPIYLSLEALPYLELFDTLQHEAKTLLKPLVAKRVQYQAVLDAKMHFLERYAKKAYPHIAKWPSFIKFKEDPWVHEYAEYKVLKEKNDKKAWWDWKKKEITPNDQPLIDFYTLVQFLCFDQMAKVKACAEHEGVFLKGDIPILINRDSVDVWKHPELFIREFSAGAPPDMYSQTGQNWGFPLYNWLEHELQGYSFWNKRLELAERLYHIYRLDHIVGFFKIWAIPFDKSASEGFFLPQDSHLWIPQGKKILGNILQNCSMLPIGEDLGAVPPEVRSCLKELGIPGTKVMRWERRWDSDYAFIDPKTYGPLSMTTVSTHDSETLGQWWEKFPNESAIYAGQMGLTDSAHLDKEKRKILLTAAHSSQSLFHINLLQEYLAMFDELSWQDINDDRINIPGLVLEENWTYRFRPSLEDIIHHKGLTKLLQELSRCQK